MEQEQKRGPIDWAIFAAFVTAVVEMLHWAMVLAIRTLRRVIRL